MRQWLLFLWLAGAEAIPGSAQPQGVGAASASHLPTSRPDTSRVLALNALCRQWSVRDAARAVQYGQQGQRLAQQLHFVRGEIQCAGSLAKAAVRQDNDIAASQYYQQIIRYPGTQPWARAEKLAALMGLGDIALRQEQYAEGVQYCQDALDLHYTASTADVAMIQNCLAILYGYWVKSGRAVPDSAARLQAHYIRLALATCRQLPPDHHLATCLNEMGLLHQQAGRLDSAAYCQEAARQLYHRVGNRFHEMESLLLITEIRAAQRRWPEVVRLIAPVIAWAQQAHATRHQAYGYHLLAQARAAMGQGLEAYRLAGLEQALLDTVQSAKRRETLARLQVQFDTERQRNRVRELTHRNQVQALKAQKQQLYLLLLGGLLLAVVAGLLVAGTLARRLRRSQALLTRQNVELAATRAEQDRLYALVAHDLRSPVVAFVGLADLMTEYVERQNTHRLLGLGTRVRQAAEGLRALLDNLLSWALAQRGEITATVEPLAVADLLADAILLYEPSAEARRIQLTTQPGGEDLYVRADLNMTRTILRNLISNALQATPAGGSIVLSAYATPQGTIALQVQDNGRGMHPEQLRQLADGAARPNPAGTRGPAGLGLRLSGLFAHTQGGQLALESVPDQGTTATLTLPAGAAPAQPPRLAAVAYAAAR